MVFGSKPGWHSKTPRAPAGIGRRRQAAPETGGPGYRLPFPPCPPARSRSPSPCHQEPGSVPTGADLELRSPGSTAASSQEPKRPQGLCRAHPGARRSPRLAHTRQQCQTSPAAWRKAPGISSKEPEGCMRGHSRLPTAPPAPGRIWPSPARVTSCSQAGEQPKLAAQSTQQGCDGEATCPGWARGSGGRASSTLNPGYICVLTHN